MWKPRTNHPCLNLARLALLIVAAAALVSCASEQTIKERNERRAAISTANAGYQYPWQRDGAGQATRPKRLDVESFEAAMALPDERFDLAQALVLFSKDYGSHEVDVEKTLAEVDKAINEFRSQVAPYKSQSHRIQMLRTYVHRRMGFDFDRLDPEGRSPENLYFDRVWKRKRGYCVTLSMVYLVLARGADIPLVGTRLPGHFAVMEAGLEEGGVIETTAGGRPRSRHELYDHFLMSHDAVEEHGAFLSELTDKQLFSTVFNNYGGLAVYRGDDATALTAFNRALQLDQRNIEALYNRSGVLMDSQEPGKVQQALFDLNDALEMEPNFYHGYCRRADLLHRFGRMEDANKDLRRARGIFPSKPYADVVEGVMRYRDGDLETARDAFSEALSKAPREESALRNLAIVERQMGNIQRAQELEAEHRKHFPEMHE